MADLSPGLFRPEVLDLLPHPLGHLSTVTAHPVGGEPVELTVEHGSLQVTFAEDWAPYAQVQVSCPAPDQYLLSLLDPRANCRLSIAAGYVYPDGRTDVHPLADVALRERPVRRPDNTVELRAASDEARAQDYRILWDANFDRAGVNEALGWLLWFGLAPNRAVIRSDFPPGYKAHLLAEIEADIGDDIWSMIDDVAARTGTRIWCDENRVWRIAARMERSGPTSLLLSVGTNGTVLDSDSGLNREEWYNTVLMRYRWRDAAGNDRTRYGRAGLSDDSDWAVSKVGHRTYVEDRERPISQAAADAAAASRLRTLVTRGHSLKLTAGAAYWLRPGHTVGVQLVSGEWGKHIVQSVTFRPHEGLMDLVTRQPANVTIRTGE